MAPVLTADVLALGARLDRPSEERLLKVVDFLRYVHEERVVRRDGEEEASCP